MERLCVKDFFRGTNLRVLVPASDQDVGIICDQDGPITNVYDIDLDELIVID
jgi:hypothetical protein